MSARNLARRSLARLVVIATILLGVMLLATAGTVQYTSRSEFCNSCHIMEPYFRSWRESAHRHVPCVDCHYEPGMLETAEGKFKALSQLAKYVTGTEGTKPWAEISDQSCMRSGCHSERLLSGPIQYGRIRFDHRHHLLETRRGRQLRCTSCHSQIVQGDHMRVTESSCFLCHFRPSATGETQGECNTCHGPPSEDLVVAGRPFRHSEYTDRGVDCQLCHRHITRGQGLARKNRCNSCHGEVEHIERFGDSTFIHENHITLHKVECNQCHEDIEHSMPDRGHLEIGGACADCHQARHEPQLMMYSGRGGHGVPDLPSRMFQTRVDCGGCHRDFWAGGPARRGGPPGVAPASEVSCMHCHGTSYASMQRSWQREVEEALPSLERALEALEAQPSNEPSRSNIEAARQNLDLVRRDGSRGVHNIAYALALLRSARDGLNAAGGQIVPNFEPLQLDIGSPVPLESTCANECHVDAARLEGRLGKVLFRHRAHLVEAGLECTDCHEQEVHGQTTIQPTDCTQCHHGKDRPECASCHTHEASLFRGTLTVEGVDLDLKHSMARLECTDCHQSLEAGKTVDTVRKMCVECHSEGYDRMLGEWQEAGREEVARLSARLKAAEERLRAATLESLVAAEVGQALARARRCLEAASLGMPAHNIMGADTLFSAAGESLEAAEALLDN